MRFLAAALLLLFFLTPALAREEILLFDSTIQVETNASLLVEETITVSAEGDEIRRGIYRDFPTSYTEAGGLTRGVGFKLLGVERDGRPEPHFTESIERGIRIYIGDEDTFLRPGEYTYTIRYRTTRQIRHFPDYDELYWNVTGNFWTFPIVRAVGRVSLPQGARITQKAAYTGEQSATRQDYRVVTENDRGIVFETTRPLRPREGLTIAVGFSKGIVAEPGALSELGWSLWDNIGFIGLAIGALAAGFYYMRTWARIGRDPERGTIIPLFSPPKDLSPAAVSYVHYQGFDNARRGTMRAFVAAIVSLAVKGRLQIDAEGDDTALVAKSRGAEPLPRGEAVIMNKFLGSRDRFDFTQANGPTIASTQSAFRSAILKEHEGVFFNDNLTYFIVGAVLSVAALASYIILQPSSEESKAGLIFGFGFALAGAFLLSMGWRRVLGWLPGGGSKFLGVLLAIVGLGLVLISVVLLYAASTALALVAAVLAIVLAITNVSFFHLLRAPTIVGRKVMDEIEGFRLYLSVAEAERMNLVGGPAMSVELFEKYLPYAVALGVEKPWSEAFEDWLKRAMPDRDPGRSYSPRWYRGSDWSSANIGRATATAVGAMAAGMASAMPSKSSSGSGGGGFSGGGGGGGGGGGW